MQGAVMNGLYTLRSPSLSIFSCQTAECTWPSFNTIGVCSSCANVTQQLNTSCQSSEGGLECNYTTPSGFRLSSSSWESSGGGGIPTLNATGLYPDTGYITNITNTLLEMAVVKLLNQSSPEALECNLTWCAKSYYEVEVTNGQILTPDIAEFPVMCPSELYSSDYRDYDPFYVNSTDFKGNRTFTVNANDHRTLGQWLADFFTCSNQDATAMALHQNPSISDIFGNMATSMTNIIRGGQNGTTINGTAFQNETYIHVRWPWLILPTVVIIMGVVLLVASIALSTGNGVSLWKSSILTLLFTRVQGWDLSMSPG